VYLGTRRVPHLIPISPPFPPTGKVRLLIRSGTGKSVGNSLFYVGQPNLQPEAKGPLLLFRPKCPPGAFTGALYWHVPKQRRRRPPFTGTAEHEVHPLAQATPTECTQVHRTPIPYTWARPEGRKT